MGVDILSSVSSMSLAVEDMESGAGGMGEGEEEVEEEATEEGAGGSELGRRAARSVCRALWWGRWALRLG